MIPHVYGTIKFPLPTQSHRLDPAIPESSLDWSRSQARQRRKPAISGEIGDTDLSAIILNPCRPGQRARRESTHYVIHSILLLLLARALANSRAADGAHPQKSSGGFWEYEGTVCIFSKLPRAVEASGSAQASCMHRQIRCSKGSRWDPDKRRKKKGRGGPIALLHRTAQRRPPVASHEFNRPRYPAIHAASALCRHVVGNPIRRRRGSRRTSSAYRVTMTESGSTRPSGLAISGRSFPSRGTAIFWTRPIS